jgi:hypothetical protein
MTYVISNRLSYYGSVECKINFKFTTEYRKLSYILWCWYHASEVEAGVEMVTEMLATYIFCHCWHFCITTRGELYVDTQNNVTKTVTINSFVATDSDEPGTV